MSIGAIGAIGGIGIGSLGGLGATTGLSTMSPETILLLQLASSNTTGGVSSTGTDVFGLSPSTLVTISQAAQDQVSLDLLTGQGTQSGTGFSELAQALILALILQLLGNTSTA